jgi:murein DD-endopeptidase MepM/ murein hydrolase activator NlpD
MGNPKRSKERNPTRKASFSPSLRLSVSPSLALALAALVFALCCLVSGAEAGPGKRGRILALRQRLRLLSQKQHQKRGQLRQIKQAQGRLSDLVHEGYERLEEANAALEASDGRLREAEAAVRDATERLQAAETELAAQRARFGRRIALSYMDGPVSYADVLLGARDLSDLLDRQYYVSRVVSHDAALLATLRRAQQGVARERKELLEREAALDAAHVEKRKRVSRVAFRTAEQERLLQAIRRERVLQERRLEELEADSGDIQRSLERELARREARPKAFPTLPQWNGKLLRPTAGGLGSGFGMRYHPILHYTRMHTGVDIGGRVGQPVFAASSGEVFFAAWRGGYGQCIILLHGGGMSTLYGHLSHISVRLGQRVNRGQLIGAVGSTGLSTGPHLHFEVRRNGAPVNPL